MNLLRLPLLALLLAPAAAAQDVCAWNGGAGDWETASNWSCGVVPGPGDDVTIGTGTVTLNEPTSVATLTLYGSAARLDGPGDLTVTEAMDWPGGDYFGQTNTMGGTGTTTIAPGATLHLSSSEKKRLGRPLVNEGTATWSAGHVTLEDGGHFTNRGALVVTSGYYFDPPVVNEAGATITVNTSGVAQFDRGQFERNDGAIRVEAGELRLSGPLAVGTAATFTVAEGATLVFRGGTPTAVFPAGAAVSGGGDVRFERDVRFEGGATYTVTGTTTINRSVTFDTGGAVTLPRLVVSGGYSRLSGGDDVVIPAGGEFVWPGGEAPFGASRSVMAGTGTTTIAAGATLRLTTDRKELHRVLESFGTTVFEGGSVWRASTGTFYNRSGAGFEATAAGSFYADLVNEEGATITLAHEGEFNMGYKIEGADFVNDGAVHVASGTLRLLGDVTARGSFDVADGAVLLFREATASPPLDHTFHGGAAVAGDGVVRLTDGAATFEAGSSLAAPLEHGLEDATTVRTDAPLAPRSYTQGAGGTLVVGLGAPPGEPNGRIAAAGSAAVAGTLRLALVGDFLPAVGDVYTVVSGSEVSGTFAAVEMPAGVEVEVGYTAAAVTVTVTAVPVASEPPPGLRAEPALHTPYPNPADRQVTLPYDMAAAGRVRLAVHDLLGREVAVLVDAERAPGRYEAVFDGRDLPAGTYLVRMTAPGFDRTRRVTLLR